MVTSPLQASLGLFYIVDATPDNGEGFQDSPRNGRGLSVAPELSLSDYDCIRGVIVGLLGALCYNAPTQNRVHDSGSTDAGGA